MMLVLVLAALVAFLGGVPVAARPAGVITGKVQTATSISYLFFILSRLANLFYLPVLAAVVGRCPDPYRMFVQVVQACAVGALLAWIALPALVRLYCLILDGRGEVPVFKVRPFRLQGIPRGFLVFNVLSSAIWTVGALSAVYASLVAAPQYAATALMLSGLVNSLAAISQSLLVDPQGALLTDEAVAGGRPLRDIQSVAWHLSLGNALGSLLGLALLGPGSRLIGVAALALGGQGARLSQSLWPLMLLNLVITLLATTAYSSRISALETGARATALSIFNLFSMVMRLAAQVLAPSLAAIADTLARQHRLELFVPVVRQVLLGASLGALCGLMLMPTFVQVYNQAVWQLQRRGSIPAVLWNCFRPAAWLGCWRRPARLGAWTGSLPVGFLWGNLLVVAIHTVGVPASIYAGKLVSPELARTATLLSSLVNGVATITLGLLVDPRASAITDAACGGRRARQDVYSMVMMLGTTLFLGTLLSQLLLVPAVVVIQAGAGLFS